VPPGWAGAMDAGGNIHLARQSQQPFGSSVVR